MTAFNGQPDKDGFHPEGWQVCLTISAAPAIEMLVQSTKDGVHKYQANATPLRDGIAGLSVISTVPTCRLKFFS